jgi:hypothetical protein
LNCFIADSNLEPRRFPLLVDGTSYNSLVTRYLTNSSILKLESFSLFSLTFNFVQSTLPSFKYFSFVSSISQAYIPNSTASGNLCLIFHSYFLLHFQFKSKAFPYVLNIEFHPLALSISSTFKNSSQTLFINNTNASTYSSSFSVSFNFLISQIIHLNMSTLESISKIFSNFSLSINHLVSPNSDSLNILKYSEIAYCKSLSSVLFSESKLYLSILSILSSLSLATFLDRSELNTSLKPKSFSIFSILSLLTFASFSPSPILQALLKSSQTTKPSFLVHFTRRAVAYLLTSAISSSCL